MRKVFEINSLLILSLVISGIPPIYGQPKDKVDVVIGEFWDALKQIKEPESHPTKFSVCTYFDFETFQEMPERPKTVQSYYEVGRNELDEVVQLVFHGESKEIHFAIDIFNFGDLKIGRLKPRKFGDTVEGMLDAALDQNHCINFAFKSKSIYMINTCNYFTSWVDSSYLDISSIMRLNRYLVPLEIQRFENGWPITHSHLNYSRNEGTVDVTENLVVLGTRDSTRRLSRKSLMKDIFHYGRGFQAILHPVLPKENRVPLWIFGGFHESK